jgi:hypothetical protein
VETSAKAAIPLPDVTMLSQLLQLNPEAHFKVGSRILKGTGTQIKGSRVWAAQYQKIHAPYVIMKQNEEFSFSRIRILSIFSAERGNGNAEAADLSVEKNYAIEADEADDLSEEYWEDFEGEVEKLDEILAEEE